MEDLTIMKELILKVLLKNTSIEGRYVGGGHEPEIIMFHNSEDCDKESFLSEISDEIAIEISLSKKTA